MTQTRLCALLLAVFVVVFAEDEKPTEVPSENSGPTAWKIRLGDICSLKRFPLPSHNPDEFFECVKPTNDEVHWPWADIGIWMVQKCQPGRTFSTEEHTCKRLEQIRKQQQSFCRTNPSYCNTAVVPSVQKPMVAQPTWSNGGCNTWTGCPPSQPCVNQPCQIIQPTYTPPPVVVTYPPATYAPQPCVQQPCPQPYVQPTPCGQQPCPQPCVQQPCPQPCQTTNCPQQVVTMRCDKAGQAGFGGQGFCSWMTDPLTQGPSQNQYYQCVPASAADPYCGRWQVMPCACGTRFDVNLQVCVHDTVNAANCPRQPQPCQPSSPCPVVQPTVYPTVQPQNCQTGTVPIYQCNSYNQCPGYSSCNSGTCCQPNYG